MLFLVGSAAAHHGGTFTKDGDVGPTTVAGATQVLEPPDDDTEKFGVSVDANGGTTAGSTLAVAAPIVDRVYIYKWLEDPHEWQHSATVTHSDVSLGTQSVSIDGNYLAVAGRAAVDIYYRNGGWTHVESIGPDDAWVEIEGGTMAVSTSSKNQIWRDAEGYDWEKVASASGDDGPVAVQDYSDARDLAAFGDTDTRQVEVWRNDPDLVGGWHEVQVLDKDCGVFDFRCPGGFGDSVDIAPTTEHKLAAGAPGSNKAFTFLDTGTQDEPYEWESNLTTSEETDAFGASINAYDGRTIVGDPGWDDGSVTNAGAVFRFEDGQKSGKLTAKPAQQDAFFGKSVHYAGVYALVGAPGRNEPGTSGEGYVGYFS